MRGRGGAGKPREACCVDAVVISHLHRDVVQCCPSQSTGHPLSPKCHVDTRHHPKGLFLAVTFVPITQMVL